MKTGSWLGLGAVAVSVLLSGALGAAEVAIARTTKVRAYRLRDDGKRGAEPLVQIAEHPARYLNVVLLLTLLLHLGATTLATAVAVSELGTFGEVIAALGMTLLLFVLAEVTPKTFAVLHTDRVALTLAPTIRFLGRAFGPVAHGLISIANWILPGKGLREGPFVTEADIRAMVDTATNEKAIEEGERRLIHSIFEFGDTVVREVMVPRPDMVMLEASTKIRDALDSVLHHGYSRVPVYRGSVDEVVGIVYAKDILRVLHAGCVDRPLASIAHCPTIVPESKCIADLLREMQATHVHMAIVVDEYGSVSGLVTIEDLLEELVGEIADEYDQEEPNLEPLEGDRFRVNARMSVEELSELLSLDLPLGEWDSIAGLFLARFGRVPAAGECVLVDGVRLTAERVQGRRIRTILLERVPESEQAAS